MVLRRAGRQMLLWAGPLSIGLALLLLLASVPFFRQGPETPIAGDPRAWGAIWAAAAIGALGCVTGLVANVAWAATVGRLRPLTARELIRAAVNVLMGAGLLIWWFGS